MKTATPIAMLTRDEFDLEKRGYEPIPDQWDYNPKTQVSSLIEMGGPSEPTTTSSVAGTTGLINTDSDNSNDDKGTD
ncbi:hypothetical protein [Planktothricoides raciborskii]|uniref:Uncharacterized protein n=2 Tax=Planktothricoides raciborskii TaxID=132608 RepID=A0AAU8JBG3_9CYAN|nr:hypothetical protein [Planktothricoides raciborskii]MBD2545463.1 hypothetical protein [Planktothricoides raciborskii FACHB-1370]MBD2583691.1 hypothetical protein [Planktothricoides raciborskii FACHB-1261]